MDEDGFDKEIQELIKSFLKSGINFFRVSNRQNKHFIRMFEMDDDGPSILQVGVLARFPKMI